MLAKFTPCSAACCPNHAVHGRRIDRAIERQPSKATTRPAAVHQRHNDVPIAQETVRRQSLHAKPAC